MRAMVQLLCGVLCRYGVKAHKGVRLQLREAVLAAETVYTGNRQSVGFHDHMVRENTTYDPVHHFAHLNTAPVAAALGGRDQWFDMRPFIVGQVTRISQFAAVVTSAVLRRPHRWCPSRIRSPL